MEYAPIRRHLRLKEWPPKIDRQLRPAPNYLAATDGSLHDIEYRVRTDTDGYIIPPASHLNEAADTVVFFGDSFVESVYVPEEQRFVAAIQSILKEADVQARCLNAGYSGATTLHMLMALIGKVGRRSATTVVLVIPSNDAFSLIKRGGFWCKEDKRYSPLVPPPNIVEVPSQPLDLMDLQAVLSLFADACHRLGLNLVLATFPHRTSDFTADSWLSRRFKTATNYTRTLEWRRSVNAAVRTIATQLHLPLVDLEALVSTRIEWFYDDVHMNEAGSKGVAQILGDFLVARYLNQGNCTPDYKVDPQVKTIFHSV